MKISVLIPFYNSQKYFKKTIQSLFENKTSINCEFIFENDGSSDDSLDILLNTINNYPQLKPNIKIINNNTNLGIIETRNSLLRNATGDYILFVDSDDWVEPNYIDEFFRVIIDSNPDIVFCDYYKEYKNKSIIFKQTIDSTWKSNLANLIMDYIPGYLFIKLIKRSIITDNNITFLKKRTIEDCLFCCNLFPFTRTFVHIKKPLYHYRIHDESFLHKNYYKMFEILFSTINEFKKILLKFNLYDEYKDFIIYRKLNTKKFFLLNNKVPVKFFKYIYTEEEFNFIKNVNFEISLKQKIYFYLVQKRFFILLKLFLFIKSITKPIIKKGKIKSISDLEFLIQ